MSPRRSRFYLDKRNGKLMGVCAGLADYTGLDVTLMRFFVVLLTFLLSPFTIVAYLLLGWIADDRPREFDRTDPEEEKFWQNVRARPGATVRDVRARFRDIDRRVADLELHYTSPNSRLADEIDSLR